MSKIISKFNAQILCDGNYHPITVGISKDDNFHNSYFYFSLKSPCSELYGPLYCLSKCCSKNFHESGIKDSDFIPSSYGLLMDRILSGIQIEGNNISDVIAFWIYYSDIRDFYSMSDTIYRYRKASNNLSAVSGIVDALTNIVLHDPFYGSLLYLFYTNPCHYDSYMNKYISSLKRGSDYFDSFDFIMHNSVRKIVDEMNRNPYFRNRFLLALDAYQIMLGHAYCFLISGHNPYPEICDGLAFPLLFLENSDAYRRFSEFAEKYINVKYFRSIGSAEHLYGVLKDIIYHINCLYDSGARILAAYILTCVVINGLTYTRFDEDISCGDKVKPIVSDFIEFITNNVSPGLNKYILNSFVDMNYGSILHHASCAAGYSAVYNSKSYKDYFLSIACSLLEKNSYMYDISLVDSSGKEVGFMDVVKSVISVVEIISSRTFSDTIEDFILLKDVFCKYFSKNASDHVCSIDCLRKLYSILFDLEMINTASYLYVHMQRNFHGDSFSALRKHIYSIIDKRPERNVISSVFELRTFYYNLIYENIFWGKSYQDLFSPKSFGRVNLISSLLM